MYIYIFIILYSFLFQNVNFLRIKEMQLKWYFKKYHLYEWRILKQVILKIWPISKVSYLCQKVNLAHGAWFAHPYTNAVVLNVWLGNVSGCENP